MFKKPRRHFRQRKLTDGSDEEDRENESVQTPVSVSKPSLLKTSIKAPVGGGNLSTAGNGAGSKASKKATTKIINPTPISFEVEGEDEEAFQVKKSSKSRMLVKRMKKEKKKERSEQNSSDEEDASNRQYDKDDKQGNSVVLNGDRAADMEMDSDYEPETHDEENKQPKHSFRSVFERGEIPDANLIHLARKKRAQAREQGDYIPLDDTENKVEQAPKSTQRLIRDDDNDASEDEERVDFSVNNALRDRQRIKDDFLAAEHGSDAESDHDRDWEEQQIRKVVGDQRPLEQPTESVDDSYYSLSSANTDYNSVNAGYGTIPDNVNLQPLPETVSLDQIKRSLTERLTNLQQVNRVHTQERENVRVGLEQSRKSALELENRTEDSIISKLNRKYQFMQEMRSYVRDLVECFNEKYEKIGELDSKLMSLYQTRAEKLCKRRQEDIKDEASDCSTALNKAAVAQETPSEKRLQAIKQIRVADREARRTRRRQSRQHAQLQSQHNNGMSSDDEESKSNQIKFQTERDAIISESNSLLDDVVDEFALSRHILDRFSDWKTSYSSDYNDAYVGLCLPKLLSPLIKLSLIDWNPLEDEPLVLTDSNWYRPVVLYGHWEQFDQSDPDNELLPLIVEKVLIPKLTGYVDMVWDPVSKSQTQKLSTLLHNLVDQYPTLNASSKNTTNLLRSLSQRITVSLDEDTFMPLYSKDLLMKSSDAKAFLHRQIWSCVKLFQNILKFVGILSDSKLKVFVLDSLLNRYIMLGLQCAGTDNCITRIKAIVDSLPSYWLNSDKDDITIPQLENLCRYIKFCVSVYHEACTGASDSVQRSNRENMKSLLKILVGLHALDHAKWISDEYSLRMPK